MVIEDERQMAWNYVDPQLYIFAHDAIIWRGSLLIMANITPGSTHLIYRCQGETNGAGMGTVLENSYPGEMFLGEKLQAPTGS